MRRKEIMEIGITALLVLLLAVVVLRAVKKIRSRQADFLRRQVSSLAVGGRNSFVGEDPWGAREAEAQKLSLKTDPFTGASLAPVASGPVLSGILWEKAHSMAIINDQIVRRGDRVDGKVVVAIEKDRVILNDGTQDSELVLF